MKGPDLAPKGIQDGVYDWSPNPQELSASRSIYDDVPTYPTIAFFGMALVLIYVIANIYKWWTKPRRKKPRLRKTRTAQFAPKMAGV